MERKVYDTEEFYIRSKMIELDKYIRKFLVNSIPSNNRDLRIHLLDELYSMIKNLHYAIANNKNIRIKSITDTLISISMIDYIFESLNKCDSVNQLHLRKATEKLLDLRNMIKSWKNKEMNTLSK